MYEILRRWTMKRERGVWVVLSIPAGHRAIVQGDLLIDGVGTRWRVSRVNTFGEFLLRTSGTAKSPSKDYLSLDGVRPDPLLDGF